MLILKHEMVQVELNLMNKVFVCNQKKLIMNDVIYVLQEF